MSNKRTHTGQGPSQRQLRVGELIRRTLSDVLNRAEIHDPELNAMSITVGEVSCSPDLKIATVYVMPLMGSVPVAEAIAALARNKAELRHRVAQDMTLKYAPDLRFRPDETFDRLDDTRRMFSDPAVARDIAQPDDAEDQNGDADGDGARD
ncbi:30S ribosome-binding factor RbfA [Xinfangfangia pollutisoli]|uniref:30S ribosome-binding factor RbfA n=1 Tax=Xinfangfangia pollutisoli TaxID=2865960 RepID=UPI001CD2799E|nr:30S ribosome-binding factor RbfA [Xinfangfangia pollutisoli]